VYQAAIARSLYSIARSLYSIARSLYLIARSLYLIARSLYLIAVHILHDAISMWEASGLQFISASLAEIFLFQESLLPLQTK